MDHLKKQLKKSVSYPFYSFMKGQNLIKYYYNNIKIFNINYILNYKARIVIFTIAVKSILTFTLLPV